MLAMKFRGMLQPEVQTNVAVGVGVDWAEVFGGKGRGEDPVEAKIKEVQGD